MSSNVNESHHPSQSSPRVHWLARGWRWMAVGGLVITAFLAASHHFVEPVNAFFLAWLYAPKTWVAMILGLLALPGWICGRGLGAILLVAAVLWAGPGLGWRWHGLLAHPHSAASARSLRVLTCNRGESGGHDFSAFVFRHDPDVMVIQQARSAGAWQPDTRELAARPHGLQVGEFAIRSRFPVVSQQLLVAGLASAKSGPRQVAPGLRCVVDAGALGQVVVYNVHLPSPRQALRVMGIETLQTSRSRATAQSGSDLQGYWAMHRDCARLIRESIRGETLPVVAMGDWNNPDYGPLYREFSDGLLDAHREVGWGYGSTFPDDVSSVFAWGRPWLRLDYVLASAHWAIAACEVEPNAEQAQHRAVAAVITLTN